MKVVPQTLEEYSDHYVDVLYSGPNFCGQWISKIFLEPSYDLLWRMKELFGHDECMRAIQEALDRRDSKFDLDAAVENELRQ